MPNEEVHDSRELLALRRAVAKALDRKRRLGQYAIVWRDGRPVRLEAEDLDGAADYASDVSAPASSVREPGPDAGENNQSVK